MKPRSPCSLLVLAVLLAGCSAATPRTPENLPTLLDNQAYVYIDGRYKGTTPNTVVVRRSFSEAEVVLRVGQRVVRTFEIESTGSSGRSSLDFSFRAERDDGRIAYNVEDLPVLKDSIHVIPFYHGPVQVNDQQYGLVLIVQQ